MDFMEQMMQSQTGETPVAEQDGATSAVQEESVQPQESVGDQGQPAGQEPPQYDYSQVYNYPVQPPPAKKSGVEIASLICGILSVLCSCCCCPFFGASVGLVAAVLALIDTYNRKTGKLEGLSLAGLICGAIGFSLSIVMMVFAFSATFADIFSAYNSTANDFTFDA